MPAPFFSVILACCVSVGLLFSCAAQAASGRVAFSGAVVEPTCSTQAAERTAAMPGASVRLACAGSAAEAATSPQTYTLQMTPLSGAPADRLLNYFAGYARGDNPTATAQLATRIYE